MKERSGAIDARAARRRFERAASTYARAARLESEVGARMFERLDYLKIAPRRILDAGSGPAAGAEKLRRRFGAAQVVALDFSLGMLKAGRKRFFERRSFVCADFGRLPFGAGSVDFIWSNMALHWAGEPPEVFREFARVLRPEGLLMFSALGPDSLKELRGAAGARRVHEFIDMHDWGDMLVGAGFAAPVMDMEMLAVSYAEPAALLDDLRGAGQTNARADRARGLGGKRFLEEARAALGREASFEIVYGHAWRGAPRKREDGRDIVQFHSRSGPLS